MEALSGRETEVGKTFLLRKDQPSSERRLNRRASKTANAGDAARAAIYGPITLRKLIAAGFDIDREIKVVVSDEFNNEGIASACCRRSWQLTARPMPA
jgi:hypothetical protein